MLNYIIEKFVNIFKYFKETEESIYISLTEKEYNDYINQYEEIEKLNYLFDIV